MKKYVFILTVFITAVTTAQNNIFPTTGKVGIGTTTPEKELEIANGGALIRGSKPSLTLKSTTPEYASWIDIAPAFCNGCYSKFAKKGSIVMRAVSYKGDFYITNPGNTGITFATGNWNGPTNPQKERMTITNIGNVGIGTTAPARLLELRQKEDPNSDSALLITEPNNDQKIALHLANNSTGQYGFLSLGGQTSLRGNGKPSYFEGFVGVGTTTSAGFKFAVNGKIRAKEIKVEANWADYVFKEGYQLPTLQQVEDHIKTNGHLINIPSEAEVAENGIQLGAMNTKLLEKIEELTLYTIAQQKEIKALQEVKAKNIELEDRLAKIETFLKKK